MGLSQDEWQIPTNQWRANKLPMANLLAPFQTLWHKADKIEKIKIDISEHRDKEIQAHNYKNIDNEYVFYYDETNNIRKFWFKNENRFNISIADISKNFILGGVAHLKSNCDFDIDALKNDLNLPNTIKEMKLKYIAKGDFLSCLKSKKIAVFLDWLISKDLFMHYFTLNILYWSLIDILESMIPQELIEIHMELKTIFYELVKIDITGFISILYKYEYPNIDRKKANAFLDEILAFMEDNKLKLISKYPFINSELSNIYQIIESSKNKELTFIVDEKSHILIDNLFVFYKHKFGVFINSLHVFDEESSIEEIFNKMDFYANSQKWKNYQFQNSENNDLIQISDVLIGLIGKLFEYINDTECNELAQIKETLTETQLKNLSTLADLFDKSDNQSTALIYSICSLSERYKLDLLLRAVKGKHHINCPNG